MLLPSEPNETGYCDSDYDDHENSSDSEFSSDEESSASN